MVIRKNWLLCSGYQVLIRHEDDGKLYLYDILEIKKILEAGHD
jgi:hypothetical protein